VDFRRDGRSPDAIRISLGPSTTGVSLFLHWVGKWGRYASFRSLISPFYESPKNEVTYLI